MAKPTRKIGAVSVNGSGYFAMKEVKADGTDLDTPDTFALGPIVASLKLGDKTPQSKEADAGGTQYVTSSVREVTLEGEFLQKDGDLFEAFPADFRTKYYSLWIELSVDQIDGNYEYLFIPVVQFAAEVERDVQSAKMPFKATIIPPGANVTGDVADISGLSGWKASFGAETVTVDIATNLNYYKTLQVAA